MAEYLSPGVYVEEFESGMVLDRNGAPGRVFFLHGAVVRKCTYSDLDAMSGQLQIDRFELAYETLECL